MSLVKREESQLVTLPSVEELERIEVLAPGSTAKIIDDYLETRKIITKIKEHQDNRLGSFNTQAIKAGTFLSSLGIFYSTFATIMGANLSDVAKVVAALATLAGVFLYFSRPKS
jgi:hypothetical protein